MDCFCVCMPKQHRVVVMPNNESSRNTLDYLRDHVDPIFVFDVCDKLLDPEFWRFISEFF